MGRIDLNAVTLEPSSPLWNLVDQDGEQVLQITGHIMDQEYPSGSAAYLDEDHVGKHSGVTLVGEPRHNCRIEAEMRFLGHHHRFPNAGWFGFVFRAQDFLNYELVWFIPKAEPGKTAAYVPVAHGIVPWWTEAYSSQQRGTVPIPADDWFLARVDVVDDEFTVFVNEQLVFKKKVTYYLTTGRVGFFAGTATDAAFRCVSIEDLP